MPPASPQESLHVGRLSPVAMTREPPAAFWLGVRSCHTLGVPHACRASRTVFGSPRCYARFLHSAGKPGYKGLVVAWPQIQRLVARVASSAGTTQEELF